MKDYSLNAEDAKLYVLFYEKKDDKIIATLANGDVFTIPYSIENEENMISIMEGQVKSLKTQKMRETEIVFAIFHPVMLPIAINNFVSNGGLLNGIALGILAGATIYYPARIISNAIKNRGIKKLHFYLDHKDELNQEVASSENLTIGISKKGIREIELKQDDSNRIDLNNIDNYKYNDLIKLKENIERIQSFGFNEDVNSLDKGPVLKRTKKKKK